MSDAESEDPETYELVIKAEPVDDEASKEFEAFFVDEDVVRSSAFSGRETIAAVGKFTAGSIGKLLAWFKQHQNRFKDATIEIGPKKVLIRGYQLDEVTDFLESGVVKKILKDLKSK